MSVIHISCRELLDSRLYGRVAGQRDFARLCEKLAGAPTGSRVLLDFDEIPLVSGSWANAALVPLNKWAADAQIDLYPILLNANAESLEEIRLVAEWNHQVYLHAVGEPEAPSRARLIGKLDPGQMETLRHVLAFGETTGAELQDQLNGKVKATAWNNRLKDLCLKRVLRRTKAGRRQIYSAVVPEILVNG